MMIAVARALVLAHVVIHHAAVVVVGGGVRPPIPLYSGAIPAHGRDLKSNWARDTCLNTVCDILVSQHCLRDILVSVVDE